MSGRAQPAHLGLLRRVEGVLLALSAVALPWASHERREGPLSEAIPSVQQYFVDTPTDVVIFAPSRTVLL